MQLLHAFRPTETQKQVIRNILSAPTPMIAASNISNSMQLRTARDMLAKLGFIEFTDSSAELTDLGSQLAADENIIDGEGNIVDDEPPTEEVPSDVQQDDAIPPMESYSFIKELLNKKSIPLI